MGRYNAFDAAMNIVQIANADYGTAGTPSADVHSMQGVINGTAVTVAFASAPQLSTGAATSAKQDTMITSLANILSALGAANSPVQSSVAVSNTSIQLLGTNTNRRRVQIQNQSPDYSVWLLINTNTLSAATATSACWKLLPGEKYKSDSSSIPTKFISAISDAPTSLVNAPVQIIES